MYSAKSRSAKLFWPYSIPNRFSHAKVDNGKDKYREENATLPVVSRVVGPTGQGRIHVNLNKLVFYLASRVTIFLIQLCLFLLTRMVYQASRDYTPAPISCCRVQKGEVQ